MATPQAYNENMTTDGIIEELSENQAQFVIRALLASGKLPENEIRSIVVHARTWIERGDY